MTCHTNVSGLYTIGDAAGPSYLAYEASHEGMICIETLAGIEGTHPLDRDYVSGCACPWPQATSLDLVESTAPARGRSVRIGKFSYQSNGKTLASGETEGSVRITFDAETGELPGTYMVGAQVTEQIQGFGIARHLEATDKGFLSMIFVHPTLSEAIYESTLAACNYPLHQQEIREAIAS